MACWAHFTIIYFFNYKLSGRNIVKYSYTVFCFAINMDPDCGYYGWKALFFCHFFTKIDAGPEPLFTFAPKEDSAVPCLAFLDDCQYTMNTDSTVSCPLRTFHKIPQYYILIYPGLQEFYAFLLSSLNGSAAQLFLPAGKGCEGLVSYPEEKSFLFFP